MPLISIETFNSVCVSVKHNPEANPFFKIRKENPVVALLLKSVLESDESESFKDGFCRGLSSMYKLVDSQLEADELNRMYS